MIDYLGALYDMVIECAALAGAPLDSSQVFRAWANRASLPSGSNEYAVMTTIGFVRHGTNIYGDRDDRLDIKALYTVDVQVDFYGGKCVDRALAMEAFARSQAGVDFLKPKGLSVIDCSDGVRDMSGVGDADQFVPRAMTTIRLELWTV